MTLFKVKGKAGNDYYVRSDMINYFGYYKDQNETNISCNGVWICAYGDITKQIVRELNKAESAKVIDIGEQHV